MKRLIQTYALATLLGAIGAHAAAQTTATGVTDPQAPAPATEARPAIDYRTEPAPAASPDRTWRDANATVGGRNAMRLTMPAMPMPGHEHEHHAGMDMGAQQCTAGGCAGMHGDGHAAHGAGMKTMQGMQCKQGDGPCGCCAGMKMKEGGCCHKEGT